MGHTQTRAFQPVFDGRIVSAFSGNRGLWPRLSLLGAIMLVIAALWALGISDYLSYDALRMYRDSLQAFVVGHFIPSLIIFALTYIMLMAVLFPAATMMTIIGGYLFGLWTGTAVVVAAATLGAVANYISARWLFHDFFQRRLERTEKGSVLRRVEAGFRRDEFNYLFLMQLLPAFPFWFTNLAAGVLGTRLRNFVLATVTGIVPGTFVFISIGNGLDAAFSAGEKPDIGAIMMQPELILPIIGLAFLGLAPVLYRKWRKAPGPLPPNS